MTIKVIFGGLHLPCMGEALHLITAPQTKLLQKHEPIHSLPYSLLALHVFYFIVEVREVSSLNKYTRCYCLLIVQESVSHH